MLKKFLLGSIAALGVVGAAAVAQSWLPFPLVGGSSFCSSTVNNSCVNTVPAGPALTGLETVPADTNKAGGASPQTVKIPVTGLGSGTLDYYVPVTGDAIYATGQTRQIIVNPAGTIANLTIAFPSTTQGLVNGQRFGFCSTQIVTTLTLIAGIGTTVANGPTALAVPVTTGAGGGCYEFIYRSANTTWYRVQ